MTTHLPPVLGGIEVHCDNLARALVRRGHDVTLFGSLEAHQGIELSVERPNDRLEIRRIPAVVRSGLQRPTRLLGLLRDVRRQHRSRPYDILHAHQIYPVGVAAAILSRQLSVGLVVTEHGSVLDDTSRPVRRVLLRWAGRRAAAIVTASHELAEVVAGAGIPSSRVTSIPNAVPEGALHIDRDRASCRRELGIEETEFLVVTVRRLVPKTGIRYAILAARECARAIPRFRLWVVGDGPERARLEALAKESGVADQIRFVGSVENQRVPLYMRAANLGLFPSLAEATSIAALEFMAAGTPVATSTVGGLPEIVQDGENGFLFDLGFTRSRYDDPGLPPASVRAVAEAVVRAHRADLPAMGARATRRVREQYTWDTYVERLELEIYSHR